MKRNASQQTTDEVKAGVRSQDETKEEVAGLDWGHGFKRGGAFHNLTGALRWNFLPRILILPIIAPQSNEFQRIAVHMKVQLVRSQTFERARARVTSFRG